MATLNVDIDVDIQDVMCELSSWEKRAICKELIEDGYADQALPTEGYGPDEEIYREAVVKLLDCYSQLSAAQVDSVIQLADQC